MNSGCVARSHPAGSVSRTGSVSRLMRAVVLIAQFEDVTPVARGVVLENARQRDRAGRHFGVGETGVSADVGVDGVAVGVGEAFVAHPGCAAERSSGV